MILFNYQVIRARRREMDSTQEDLAQEAGITQAYLCSIEKGRKNPSSVTLCKLAEALDITIDELFTEGIL